MKFENEFTESRERQRETERDRERQRETERDRERQRETDRHTCKDPHSEAFQLTFIQTFRKYLGAFDKVEE